MCMYMYIRDKYEFIILKRNIVLTFDNRGKRLVTRLIPLI